MSAATVNHMRLDGKVAVVTGAAQGVGFGIAQEFIDHGARVVVADLHQDAIDAAVSELGSSSHGVVADVTSLAQMESLYGDVMTRYGRLDAVVANVSAGDSSPLGSITEAQFVSLG